MEKALPTLQLPKTFHKSTKQLFSVTLFLGQLKFLVKLYSERYSYLHKNIVLSSYFLEKNLKTN